MALDIHRTWDRHVFTETFLLSVVLGLYYIGSCTGSIGIRLSFTIYLWAFLLFYISTGSLEAIARYLAVLFPIYILQAEILDKHCHSAPFIWGINIILMTISISLFVNGYWFT